ncbi:MAG: nitrate reductase, partial [Aquificota bacterium]
MRYTKALILGLIFSGVTFSQEMVCKRVKSLPLDPFDKVWASVKPLDVSLSGQAVTVPMELKPSVTSIAVRCLNDGKSIAFHMTWSDKTEDRFHLIGKFSDAVAVQ